MIKRALIGILLLLGMATCFAGENTSIYPGLRRGVIYQAKSAADSGDINSTAYPVVELRQRQTATVSMTFSNPAATSKIVLIRYWSDGTTFYPESTSSYTVTAQAWTLGGRYCGNAIDFDTAAYAGFSVLVQSISAGDVTVVWSVR